MNQNSPGRGSLDDDVEMLAMNDAAERQLQKPLNGAPHKPADESSDSDDDEFDVDEGQRGLLESSSHHDGQRREYSESSRLETAGKLWHKVKSIVVEVSEPNASWLRTF